MSVQVGSLGNAITAGFSGWRGAGNEGAAEPWMRRD